MIQRLLLVFFLVLISFEINAQESGNYKNRLADKNVTVNGGGLPIVFIDVKGKTIQKNSRILAYMKIINNEDGVNYSDTIAHPGQHVDYEGWVGLKYRGNSSFSQSDKKPYAIQTLATNQLTEDGGEKQKTKILGMGKDHKWAMLAPWADKSMIRDALAFELGRPWFDFVPHTRFCEVILDGTYYGVYIFTERVSKGNKRLNLNDPGEDGGDMTGDYQVEIDRSDSPYYASQHRPWRNLTGGEEYDHTIKYQYVSPEDEDFYQFTGAKAALQNEIDKMEDSFMSDNWKDEKDGYRKYIDVNSFIDYMLSTEFAMNIDGYRLSTNLFKYSRTRGLMEGLDSRWKMSLWDFNIAYGNANYYNGDRTDKWQYDFNSRERNDAEHVPFYWYRMLSDESYVSDMKARWKAYRENNYSDENLFALVDSLSNRLVESGAVDRNQQAWQILGKWGVWPCPTNPFTYDEEMSNLRTWMERRLDWMDTQLLGKQDEPSGNTTANTTAFAILNGFNEDIVAENQPVAQYTTTGMDADNVFYTTEVNTSGGIASREVVAKGSGVKYSLGDFTDNNALMLTSANTSGTLTLVKPSKTEKLYILGTSTNGASTFKVKVNYTDGTSGKETSITFADWSVRNPTGEEAVVGLGRCGRSNDSFAQDPHYCMFDAAVAADAKREIESVTFTHVDGVRTFVTALSGNLLTHDALLIADRASAGTSGAENYEKLFDNDVNTKWGFNWNNTEVSVVFHATYPIAVESYTITTANDNESNKGRNPKSWKLYGSTSETCPADKSSSWILIHEVGESGMQDVNFTPYKYNVGSSEVYRYFKWVITARQGSNEGWSAWDKYTQMSEFHIATATDVEVSGLSAVTTTNHDNSIYDLQGRKMNPRNLPAGVYIQNGRKFVVK